MLRWWWLIKINGSLVTRWKGLKKVSMAYRSRQRIIWDSLKSLGCSVKFIELIILVVVVVVA